MTLELPDAIESYFEADRGRGEAVADCFSPDAIVKDEGNTYRGIDEIRRWRSDVAAKYTYSCKPQAVDQQNGHTAVACRLVGDFPGSPANLRFLFAIAGGKIESLEIVP
ncbi:SnoaL-like domain protein [Botrimarina colliarenosi]|uniref:SnoaL-like domain protein n=1 Tax=Botrimarina colliarenosi TaxID=2528001 RepID=A0A5C6AKV7_9BACT|nr:nuclear transport factor 2 family protein [Botrimarina colliarenosi]TWU00280.1 SnoaL-like domain protein [Botrimarina colliarenosi]